MWLFTKSGFYSIVRKDNGEWHVRSRAKKDLENLVALSGKKHWIHRSPNADYRWRIVCRGLEARLLIDRLAAGIDYANFKAAVGATPDQADKLPAYHEIWGAMASYQDEHE